jgi:hypothetical protein
MTITAGEALTNMQAKGVQRLAHDLASLLQRAFEMGICLCPDIDEDEGNSYILEAQHGEATVEWNAADETWEVVDDAS